MMSWVLFDKDEVCVTSSGLRDEAGPFGFEEERSTWGLPCNGMELLVVFSDIRGDIGKDEICGEVGTSGFSVVWNTSGGNEVYGEVGASGFVVWNTSGGNEVYGEAGASGFVKGEVAGEGDT